MESIVRQDWSDEVLTEACSHINALGKPEFIRYFENAVYEIKLKDGTPVILRLTHFSHRSLDEVNAELHWLNYLHEHQLPVATALKVHGQAAIPLEAGHGKFIASYFLKAQGALGKEAPFTPDWLNQLGTAMGTMHRLTKLYDPPTGFAPRKPWYDDEVLHRMDELPAGNEEVIERIQAQVEKLKGWQSQDYGLIHADIHPGNFCVHQGMLKIFDFDDCTYNFFMADLSTTYYAFLNWTATPDTIDQMAKDLQDYFWGSYCKEYQLETGAIVNMHDLMLLREMIIYVVIHLKLYPDRLTMEEEQLLASLKEDILRGKVKVADYLPF